MKYKTTKIILAFIMFGCQAKQQDIEPKSEFNEVIDAYISYIINNESAEFEFFKSKSIDIYTLLYDSVKITVYHNRKLEFGLTEGWLYFCMMRSGEVIFINGLYSETRISSYTIEQIKSIAMYAMGGYNN